MLELHRYQASDAAALGQIFQSAILGGRKHYSLGQREAWAAVHRWNPQGWRTRMDGISPWVARLNGEPVGYADVQPSGLIDHFFVHPQAQGQGVARALMTRLFAQASEVRLKEMYSEVSRNAQPLYAKFGFSPIDIMHIESLGAEPTTIARMARKAPFELRSARVGDPPNFELQPAVTEDFEAVLALRIRAMRPSLERLSRFDPQRARERLSQSFDAAHVRHITSGGARVGFVTLKPLADGNQRLAHLYIEPSAQGRGLGPAVLRHICAKADAAGQHLFVGVLDQSDALRFYLRAGFACVSQSAFDWELHRPPSGFALA